MVQAWRAGGFVFVGDWTRSDRGLVGSGEKKPPRAPPPNMGSLDSVRLALTALGMTENRRSDPDSFYSGQ